MARNLYAPAFDSASYSKIFDFTAAVGTAVFAVHASDRDADVSIIRFFFGILGFKVYGLDLSHELYANNSRYTEFQNA